MRRPAILIPMVAVLSLGALALSAAAGYRLAPKSQIVVSDPATAQEVTTPADTPAKGLAALSDAGEASATVLVSGMRFQPEVVRVKAGQSVAWVFNDPGVVHSVSAFDGSFNSGLKQSGSFVLRFDMPGTYCYQCSPHPGPNLCEQGAVPSAGPMLLVADPIRGVAATLNLTGGGGRMQGKVIVEE